MYAQQRSYLIRASKKHINLKIKRLCWQDDPVSARAVFAMLFFLLQMYGHSE